MCMTPTLLSNIESCDSFIIPDTYYFLNKPIDTYIIIYEHNYQYYLKFGVELDLYLTEHTDFELEFYHFYTPFCETSDDFNEQCYLSVSDDAKIDLYYVINLSNIHIHNNTNLLYNNLNLCIT